MSFLNNLFDTSGFPPRWYCGSAWTESLGWIHIISDLIIFSSYVAIPVALIYLIRGRKDVLFIPILWLFAAFILFCGISHLVEATIFWYPWYRFSGLIKLITATISVITAIVLIKILPKILTIPSIIKKKADLENLIDNFDIAFFILNRQGQIVFVNREALTLTGISLPDLKDAMFRELLPERLWLNFEKSLQEILDNREDKILKKFFIIKEDKNLVPVELSISALREEEKINFCLLVKDLTSSRAAKQEQRKQIQRQESLSNRLNAVLNGAVDGIITISHAGIIESFNHSAERIFGYSADEAIGKEITSILSPSGRYDSTKVKTLLKTHLTDADHKNEDLWFRKDGSTFPVEYSLIEALIEGEMKFIASVKDISIRKAIENKLHLAYLELEEFVYIASHDLKEPLRGIHNYATFLIEDYADIIDQSGRDKLYTLKSLTARLDKFIDDLLYYSRVDKTELAVKAADLNEVVNDVIESLRITINEKNISVNVHELPTLVCDKARIAEVFRNLITNAMKYNDKEDKLIDIGCDLVETQEEKPVYTFYVRDNGIGIPEKYHQSIFKIFKRLHGRDKFGGGTGAGLTITQKIVNQHGGKIWVESVLGEGTTFYFTLRDKGVNEETITTGN